MCQVDVTKLQALESIYQIDSFDIYIDILNMTLQQLEYIVAVDRHRNFVQAAEACHVTQPTLSMMIRKLEDELGFPVFDRNRHPVVPTPAGCDVLDKAAVILNQVRALKDVARDLRGELTGTLHMGVIPTLAPYLLPAFLGTLTSRFPQLSVVIHERMTDACISGLRSGTMDLALAATPLHQEDLREYPLFNEELLAYIYPLPDHKRKAYILPADLDPEKLWLLEEGHCLRSQILNLCERRTHSGIFGNLTYEAGSLTTLMHLTEQHGGATILPELATIGLDERRKKHLRRFRDPAPVREVSLITAGWYARNAMIKAVSAVVQETLPALAQRKRSDILDIRPVQ